jgi:hypothetical protein
MPLTLRGSWPEADFIASSESSRRALAGGSPRCLDPAEHGHKSCADRIKMTKE